MANNDTEEMTNILANISLAQREGKNSPGSDLFRQ
jgi:hypothetical protein